MNRVLIVTYYWPPSGGAGVQRWLKFAKYLPEFGWEPVILTVDPEYAVYPSLDNSLGKDLDGNIEVSRTKATNWFRFYPSDKLKIPSAGFANNMDNSWKGKISRFIRGNFFIPDPRRGWNKFAFRKACNLIEKEKITTILTTSPPHSTQIIGLRVKKKYPGIKWIVDLRDPWTDIYYYDQFYPTFLSKKIDSWYEKRVLRESDRIITVGPTLKALFSMKIKETGDKTEVITNGYDDSDFLGNTAGLPSRFTITYTGTLSDKYPLYGLLKAMKKTEKKHKDILLRFVGTVPDNIKRKLMSEITMHSIEFIPYTNHETALTFMANSSMLLLVIPEHVNNKTIVTGKVFEYIASERPILCLGPVDGDAANLLNQKGFGKCFDYNDINGIENFILSAIENPVFKHSETEEFSHRNIAKKLVSFL
jgi:glycosyltransferase involved in cell wall biosynthesis